MRSLNMNEATQVAGAIFPIQVDGGWVNIHVPSTGLTEYEYKTIDAYFEKAYKHDITWKQFESSLSWNSITRTAIDIYMQNFRDYPTYLPY